LDGIPPNGGYNTDKMSIYQSVPFTTQTTYFTPTAGSVAQCFYGVPLASKPESGERSTPAFWPYSSPYLYTVGTADTLKAYPFNASTGTFTVSSAPASGGASVRYPGATPVLTSNGTDITSAVVWVLDTSGFNGGTQKNAVLTAYKANPNTSGVLSQIWTSGTTGPGATSFMLPTIANGRAYVAGQLQNSSCNSTP
jgi:hypothetical protein